MRLNLKYPLAQPSSSRKCKIFEKSPQQALSEPSEISKIDLFEKIATESC